MCLSPLPVSPPLKGRYTSPREGQRLQEGPLFLWTVGVEGTEVRLSLVWGNIEPYSLPLLASLPCRVFSKNPTKIPESRLSCEISCLHFMSARMVGSSPVWNVWESSMLSVLYPVIPVFKFNFEPQPSCSYVCSYVIYEYEVGFKVTRVVHTNALIQSLELALQSFDSIPSALELCLAVKNPALLQHKPAAVSSACLSWHTPACLAWVQHRPFWIKIVICLLTGLHSSFHGLQNHRPKGLFFYSNLWDELFSFNT